jgi:hypothetical protein
MSQAERTLKDKQLSSIRIIMELTRDGELSILTLIRDHKRRDFMLTSVSIVTDHSILSQDFQ